MSRRMPKRMKRCRTDMGPSCDPLWAWVRVIAPAALFMAAGAIVRRGLLWAVVPAFPALPLGQARPACSAGATLLLAPLALIWVWRDAPARRSGLTARTALASAGIGLSLGILTALAARTIPGLHTEEAALKGPLWLTVLCAVALCLAGPLCEEAIYRGLVFRRGEALLGTLPAALLSAALFAVGHGGVAGMAAAFAAGLVFAGAMILPRHMEGREASLLPPFICHAAANLVALAAQFMLLASPL